MLSGVEKEFNTLLENTLHPNPDKRWAIDRLLLHKKVTSFAQEYVQSKIFNSEWELYKNNEVIIVDSTLVRKVIPKERI